MPAERIPLNRTLARASSKGQKVATLDWAHDRPCFPQTRRRTQELLNRRLVSGVCDCRLHAELEKEFRADADALGARHLEEKLQRVRKVTQANEAALEERIAAAEAGFSGWASNLTQTLFHPTWELLPREENPLALCAFSSAKSKDFKKRLASRRAKRRRTSRRKNLPNSFKTESSACKT